MRTARRPLFAASLAAAVLAAGACTPIRTHQGYVIDSDLVNSVQPGVDNRQSVAQTLGRPSFASQFGSGEPGGGDWYYVSRDSRNFAFRNPKARDQIALRISFDKAGTVTAIHRTGVEQIASISPESKITPTLGRKRGFFQDLFGNIGTVGAAGVGGGGGGANGGGRETP
jgi:outer membrane protein assembly factor BamE (lipoprotein component of BamABCDE complex)